MRGGGDRSTCPLLSFSLSCVSLGLSIPRLDLHLLLFSSLLPTYEFSFSHLSSSFFQRSVNTVDAKSSSSSSSLSSFLLKKKCTLSPSLSLNSTQVRRRRRKEERKEKEKRRREERRRRKPMIKKKKKERGAPLKPCGHLSYYLFLFFLSLFLSFSLFLLVFSF
ncbi:hypothetical protein CSUI_005921 [Cystoisospora suis]|uniref:Transmembrane protein n=1 Tax=Cystoisospora suis TaxID=483139 RepID=A0A2C6KS47_9APIC|nr:hypothetical protein CSUI_005921 [Cystoisospora suis]